jgi:hypothetical protein
MSVCLEPEIGVCRLCLRKARLQQSHIWPRFVYARYVINPQLGGSFLNLTKGAIDNRHVKLRLLCRDCESRFSSAETYAAAFLRLAEQASQADQSYDGQLSYFAVSVSWRIAQFNLIRGNEKDAPALLGSACRQWRQFLLGKRRDVRPYSQHSLLAFGQSTPGKDAEWHKSLGGEVFPNERLIFARLGPLLLFALLDRKNLGLVEINTLELSRLKSTGGIVQSISKARLQPALTYSFTRVLSRVERRLIQSGSAIAEKRPR